MLIKHEHLQGIERGEITLAFRRWKRPTVRTGGTLRTRIGVLSIDSVERVTERAITSADARQAGFASRDDLLLALTPRGDRGATELYRVRLQLQGADPRIALRQQDKLTAEQTTSLRDRLARFDAASRRGAWTATALQLIADHPATRAEDLAEQAGWEKRWFKGNVRKLKELGLTESLEIGYRLSPRGRALRRRLGS